MRVVAVVEPPLELLEVAVDVFHANLVKRADDRPLKQAPYALDRVCVNVTDDPFLSAVVNGLVPCVVVRDAEIRLQAIGVDGFRFVLDSFVDEIVQRVATYVRDMLETNLPAPLDGAGNVDLVAVPLR